MKRTKLVVNITIKADITKKDSDVALKATLDTITEALKNGDRIASVELGTFEIRKRAARKGKNPQTEAKITIAASKVPTFKAGKFLKEIVNK